MSDSLSGFILSRQWIERDAGQDLVFWLATDRGPLQVTVHDQPSVFFAEEDDVPRLEETLKDLDGWHHESVKLESFSGAPVVACYFPTQRQLNFARSRLARLEVDVFESDLRPTDRFLMERFITGSADVAGDVAGEDGSLSSSDPRLRPSDFIPTLKVVSIDIETSITHGNILSIAAYGADLGLVFMVSGTDVSAGCEVRCSADEAGMLREFLAWFATFDPDIVIGWNVVGFDLNFMSERCELHGLRFALGRRGEAVHWRRTTRGVERLYALVPGRAVLDGIEMLRTATYSFESFALDHVARELLGEGKLVDDVDARAHEIEDMYVRDRGALADYNLQDCRLVWDIFERERLIDFAVERSRLTGLDVDRAGGSVAAFDFLYLPRLHREGFVAPAFAEESESSPGGFVLDSEAGLFSDVVVLDFKSLYPSIIRTFHVDPLALVTADEDAIEGFRGARFSRTRTILPRIIEGLWQARDQAKKEGRAPVSQAIKIIMNSFYGVLGTPACRFFDARLASSITMRGHEILQKTRELIENRGFPVIYGDTDSVFVHFGADSAAGSDERVFDVASTARELTAELNHWWRQELQQEFRIESFLEVEYETHFDRFLMPRIRGSEKGSKKRYAGLVTDAGRMQLVFKGLETVRSDWSPLAREFQQELYRRVFLDEPFEDYVKETVAGVRSGRFDGGLLLRRRMRRPIEAYVKNVPPHVRAARRLVEERAARGLPKLKDSGGWVEYFMTTAGPEPRQYLDAPLDYDFYVTRQLAPIADGILSFKGTSLGEITDPQLQLF